MSFMDKISNGVAILLIQNEREKLQSLPLEDAEFLRQVYCVLPSIAAIIAREESRASTMASEAICLQAHKE
ncbi:Glycoside-pentoside-hexuronide [Globisporangium polare]